MNIQNNLVVTGVLAGVAGLIIGVVVSGGGHRGQYGMMHRENGSQERSVQDGYDSQHGQGMGMQDTMGGMMGGLQGLSGDALDKAFLSEMIMHHQGAVQMAQTLLAGTKRPELIKMANDIIKAQSAEIAQMQAWQTAWFAGK